MPIVAVLGAGVGQSATNTSPSRRVAPDGEIRGNSTLGFQPDARLDQEEMWPVAFALTSLTAASEERIAELVKKAAG